MKINELKQLIREIITESTVKFTIPKGLQKYVDISGDMSNAKSWNTNVFLNNSGNKKVGSMDRSRYVLISLDSTNIIPVAIADEHRIGYELLEHLIYEKIVPNENYQSMCSTGDTFIWNNSEQRDNFFNAFTKFKSYGGNMNLKVIIADSYPNVKTNIGTYLELNGDVSKISTYYKSNNKLSPEGDEFIAALQDLATLYAKYEDANEMQQKGLMKKLLDELDGFRRLILRYKLNIDKGNSDFFYYYFQKLYKQSESDDMQGMIDTIFSMNGLKNDIHVMLKNNKNIKELTDFFGSTKKLKIELDKISGI